VIPTLEAGVTRDLRAVLARQATLARADSDLLDELAADVLTRAAGDPGAEPPVTLAKSGDYSHFGRQPLPPPALDVTALTATPEALARRALRLWLGPPPPAAGHIEAILAVVRGERRAAELPGGIEIGRSGCWLHCRTDGASPGAAEGQAIALDLPGTATGFGVELTAWVERAAPVRWPDGRWTAVVDADLAGDRAVLRPSGPGERFVPLGLTGHKAVSDALAEAGVPAHARAGHPILAAPLGDPLWVLGYRIDDRVRVSPDTRRFLWLTVEAGG
jgi:tRNA(Ile)-lysidine synthase